MKFKKRYYIIILLAVALIAAAAVVCIFINRNKTRSDGTLPPQTTADTQTDTGSVTKRAEESTNAPEETAAPAETETEKISEPPISAAPVPATDQSPEPTPPPAPEPAPEPEPEPEPIQKDDPEDQKREQALAVARSIAAQISGDSDIDRVSAAAAIVADYCQRATYTMSGEDYATAYGVFVKGEYSCAGSTRALGMLLECMGYSWRHVNENLYTHQWVEITMDGQRGWADGQIGMAGYGDFPFAEEVSG